MSIPLDGGQMVPTRNAPAPCRRCRTRPMALDGMCIECYAAAGPRRPASHKPWCALNRYRETDARRVCTCQ